MYRSTRRACCLSEKAYNNIRVREFSAVTFVKLKDIGNALPKSEKQGQNM